jgi:Flp pilus assembly protein TadG
MAALQSDKTKRKSASAQWQKLGLWRDQRGTQLLEFALMLPMLLVMAVGTVDFAAGFVLKQKLTNAARDGARIGSELSALDSSQPIPNSVQAIRNAVWEYLDNADIDVTAISDTPTKSGFVWTYSGGGAEIIIDRGVAIPVTSGGFSLGTRVRVRYPYTWSFAQVIQIMIQPPPPYSNTITISAEAVMRNLSN